MYYVARTLFPVTAIQNKKIEKTEPLTFFNSGNYVWNSERPEVGNISFFQFFQFFTFFNSRNSIFQN